MGLRTGVRTRSMASVFAVALQACVPALGTAWVCLLEFGANCFQDGKRGRQTDRETGWIA
jgi:hypothetical protein